MMTDGRSPDQPRSVGDAELVLNYYEQEHERDRLMRRPVGVLERLRTWDVFERFLPPSGVIHDVGGGAGVHARWLSEHGYEVQLFDPFPIHITQAAVVAEKLDTSLRFSVEQADGRSIPRADGSADVVLLLGPLYHLFEHSERAECLMEAQRLLKPGGLLIAAGISRFSWLLDAYRHGLAGDEQTQSSITYSLQTGRSTKDPEPGSFHGYLHLPDELMGEIADCGFADLRAIGVEGFASLLGDLEQILENESQRDALLSQLRETESEPSMLGVSNHLLVLATKPA